MYSAQLYKSPTVHYNSQYGQCARRLRSATIQRLLVRRTRLRTIGDRRCCTARLERPACWHRFCAVTGHFQAALEDSSVWTIIRLTTDLVTCPWSFAYGRINTVVNNKKQSGSGSKVNQFVHVPTSVDTQHFIQIHARVLSNLANRQTNELTRAKTFISSFVGGY